MFYKVFYRMKECMFSASFIRKSFSPQILSTKQISGTEQSNEAWHRRHQTLSLSMSGNSRFQTWQSRLSRQQDNVNVKLFSFSTLLQHAAFPGWLKNISILTNEKPGPVKTDQSEARRLPGFVVACRSSLAFLSSAAAILNLCLVSKVSIYT